MLYRGKHGPRPMPSDFPEMFVRLGWEAIEDHYCAGQTTIRRWMRQVGEAELIIRRRGYMRKLAAAKGWPMVGGRKPAKRFGFTEMCAGDPALEFLPVRRLRRAFRFEEAAQSPGCMSEPVRAAARLPV